MKNILTLADLGKENILKVLDLADEMRPHAAARTVCPWRMVRPVTGGSIPEEVTAFLLMIESSTRTGRSGAAAVKRLGGAYQLIEGQEANSLVKGETLANMVRTLVGQCGADILYIRHKYEGLPKFLAEIIQGMKETYGQHYHVPVINAGDGKHGHPTQGFTDGLHMRRKLGRLENFRLGIVGETSQSRVCTELLTLARLFGFEVSLFCPKELMPPANWFEGVTYSLSEDLQGIEACDAVYILRLQKERVDDPMKYERMLAKIALTDDVVKRCKPDVFFMHAQPIDQNDSILRIRPGLFADPRFASIHQQAEEGLCARMAALFLTWQGREEDTVIPAQPKIKPIPGFKTETVEAMLNRIKRKRGRLFNPIEIGVVIDHLPFGSGQRVLNLLYRIGDIKHGDGKLKALISDLESTKLGGLKDIIILKDTLLGNRLMATLQALWPTATFNVCEGGDFRKLKFPLPKVIDSGICICPNPVCIAHNDPEAQARFHVTSLGEGTPVSFRCDFCDRPATAAELESRL